MVVRSLLGRLFLVFSMATGYVIKAMHADNMRWPYTRDEDQSTRTYQGALVQRVNPGLHKDVVVIDFSSLTKVMLGGVDPTPMRLPTETERGGAQEEWLDSQDSSDISSTRTAWKSQPGGSECATETQGDPTSCRPSGRG